MTDVEIARRFVKKHDRAIKSDHEFTLTFFEYKKIVSKKTCAYSGIPFSALGENREWLNEWTGLTLERIDNSKGYVSGNVVPVCGGINQIKAQWENPQLPLDEKMTIRIIENISKMKKKINC